MSTYLYAPKDDYKHRLYWRELYCQEETGWKQTNTLGQVRCAIYCLRYQQLERLIHWVK